MKASKCFHLAVGLIGIMCAVSRAAQPDLHGVVLDPSGSPIPGARIECGGRTAVSAVDGRFLVPSVDRCQATVAASGFETRKLVLAADAEVPISLVVAGVSERVVVTATRAQVAIEEAGVAASVITRSDLAQRDFPMLPDLLREIPGLQVTQIGRKGGLATVYARGAQRTGTLVLLDGARLNDPGGEINFANQTSSAIERIEVVRAPESALFGAEASAAVVQMFTRRGDPESRVPHGSFSYERGSFQTDRWIAGLSGGSGRRLDYALNAEQFHTVSQFHNDFYRNTTGTANLGFRLAPSTELRGVFQSFDSHLGVPGQVGYGIFNLDAHQASRDYTLSLRLDDVRGRNYLQHFSFNFHRLHDVYADNGLGGPYDVAALVRDVRAPEKRVYLVSLLDPKRLPPAAELAPGTRVVSTTIALWPLFEPYVGVTSRKNAEYQGTLTHAGGALVVGYEFERQDGDLTGTPASRDNHGAFLHKQQRLGRRVFLSGGVRVEHSSAFGRKIAPRGAASFLVAGEHGPLSSSYFRVSAGHGITEPSLLQNFAKDAYYTGNPRPRPEKTTSYEAGFVQEWFNRRVRSEASVFHNSFTDLIAFVSVPPPVWGTWENVEASHARGVELSSQARLVKHVTLGAAYTRLWTRILRSTSPASPFTGVGQELGHRPRNSGSAWLSVTARRWWFHVGAVITGERQDNDFFGVTRNPGYQNVYAGGSYRLSRHVSPFLRLDNLLNTRYSDVLGYPSLSRGVRGGLRLEW